MTGQAFSGGVTRDADGAVVGCWLVDAGGALAPPRAPTLHAAWREGCRAVYEVTSLPRGTPPPGDASPASFASGWRRRRPFLEMVRMLRPDGVRAMAAQVTGTAADAFASATAAMLPFALTLDPAALAVAPMDGSYPDGTYEGLDATFAPDALLARAWARHPWCRMTLARAWEASSPAFATDASTDAALAGALAASEGVPARLLQALGTFRAHLDAVDPDVASDIRAAVSGGRDAGDPERAILTMGRILATLPANWVPRSNVEWDALVAAMPAVDLATHFAAPADWAPMLDARGRWIEFAARLRASAGGRMPLGGDMTSDAGDVAAAFERQVLAPAVAASEEGGTGGNLYPAAWASLWGGRTACAIARASHDWHGARAALAELAGEGATAGDVDWPAAFGDHADDGVALTVLTSARELREEGVKGRHCVAGYVGACLEGRSRIVSARGADGTWLSTVEIRAGDGGPRVGQHRGRGNGDPPPGAARAVAAYVSGIRDGSVAHDPRGLAPLPDTRPRPAGPPSPANLAARIRAWGPFLPRRLRGIDAGTLAAEAGALAATRGRWLWKPRR